MDNPRQGARLIRAARCKAVARCIGDDGASITPCFRGTAHFAFNELAPGRYGKGAYLDRKLNARQLQQMEHRTAIEVLKARLNCASEACDRCIATLTAYMVVALP
jgi:hypothetical protein